MPKKYVSKSRRRRDELRRAAASGDLSPESIARAVYLADRQVVSRSSQRPTRVPADAPQIRLDNTILSRDDLTEAEWSALLRQRETQDTYKRLHDPWNQYIKSREVTRPSLDIPDSVLGRFFTEEDFERVDDPSKLQIHRRTKGVNGGRNKTLDLLISLDQGVIVNQSDHDSGITGIRDSLRRQGVWDDNLEPLKRIGLVQFGSRSLYYWRHSDARTPKKDPESFSVSVSEIDRLSFLADLGYESIVIYHRSYTDEMRNGFKRLRRGKDLQFMKRKERVQFGLDGEYDNWSNGMAVMLDPSKRFP
jgi:hypothetical protein